MLFVGLHICRTACEALVLDLESGSVLSRANAVHHGDAATEQDPTLWLQAIDSAVRDCLSHLDAETPKTRTQIAGIGLTASVEGGVFLDEQNRIIVPALADPARTTSNAADQLMRAFGGSPGMIEMGGNRIAPSNHAAQLLWLKTNHPDAFSRLSIAFTPHDFANFWLTNVARSEFSEASSTGLFDCENRAWRDEICAAIAPDLSQKLPAVASSRQPIGILRPELCENWGLNPSVLVSAGCSELAASALSSSVVDEGSVQLHVDSEIRVSAIASSPFADTRGEIQTRCDAKDDWLSALHFTNGISVVEAFASHYGLTLEQVEQYAASVATGADGLCLLPYLQPEKTPHLSEGSGVLHGLTAKNFTIAHLCRAAFESIALTCAYGLSRLRDQGLEASVFTLTGNGSQIPLLRQMIADACDASVIANSQPTSAALGVAIQAAVTFFQQNGETLSYQELAQYLASPDEASRCSPDQSAAGVYASQLSHRQYLAETLQDAGFL